MKTQYLEIVKDFCDDSDYTIHDSYTGRGMYNKTCVGISGDARTGQILLELVKYSMGCLEDLDQIEDFITFLENYAEDNLGLGSIVYFPYLQSK